MLLLLQPRDQPWGRVKALGTARGPGTRLRACAGSPGLRLLREYLLPATSQVLNFECFSTKGHYHHSLATPHQALPALQKLLSATPWKVLAQLRGWGALNVLVLCRQTTLQEQVVRIPVSTV